jgi:hypothetical protein
MPTARDTTTVRVSRHTQKVASDLAASDQRSLSDLLADLVERERRRRVLEQYHARMRELAADPDEGIALADERA